MGGRQTKKIQSVQKKNGVRNFLFFLFFRETIKEVSLLLVN